jgi:pilus assembly protein CpaE
MLRAAVICPNRELGDQLVTALLDSHRVGIVRRLDTYPSAIEIARFMRATAPEVVFLSIETKETAFDILSRIEKLAAGTQVVAVNRICDPPTLLETMRAGIREFLSPPFEPAVVLETVKRIEDLISANPPSYETTDSVFAFLPAKAGSGATTIAVNTCLALSKMKDMHVLLADLDLNSGLVGFMLSMNNTAHSIVDAAENALDLDENLWPKLVSSKDNLDVLPAGKLSPGIRIEGTQIRHILGYARRHYSAICVDLSGMMERYTLEVLHEAKRVYLVTTSELPALHLAREKLAFLRSQELDGRVSVILNRYQKRGQIAPEEIEKLFGMPVHMTIPNDYAGVHAALTAAKQVSPSSALGSRFRELAESMVNKKPAPAEKKRGLFDALTRKGTELGIS